MRNPSFKIVRAMEPQELFMKRKALALLSGGLDSTLAVKMMLDMGIEVEALNFTSPFCTCTGKNSGCKSEAVRVAQEFDIPIKVIHKGLDYLEIVRNPKHGYGKGVNPCVDCRIYLLQKAKEYMLECGADFVITGEVLGQRPMSQRRDSMRVIERESGLEGLLLRPLSAHHLEPTIPEQEGWVDRERLLAIKRRSRKEQIQQAIKGLNNYAMAMGETVASGPFFKAYVVNLLPGQFVQPFVDAAFSDLGLDPATLLPSQLADPQTGQPATPPLPVPYPRTGQGGDPRLTLPEAITGNSDPHLPAQYPGRYPYRPEPPAPVPGGPPPGPPIASPGQASTPLPSPSPVLVPAPLEPGSAGERP